MPNTMDSLEILHLSESISLCHCITIVVLKVKIKKFITKFCKISKHDLVNCFL